MSRHEWVNSTLGHGANMCRHCLMTDAEAAALGCLDTCDAERTPTDAEIEAMAERLWLAWQSVEAASGEPMTWNVLLGMVSTFGGAWVRNVAAFRAMARVALEGRGE